MRGDVDSEQSSDENSFPFLIDNPRPEGVLGDERAAYETLCRGEEIIPKRSSSPELTCRYVNHDYQLLIAPVKQELVAVNPHIWLFHDVITDRQIEIMKILAYPKVTALLNWIY